MTISKYIYLSGGEHRVEGLEFPNAIPRGSILGSAFAFIPHSSIQVTIRNIAGTAANVMLNNLSTGAAEGTVYLTIFLLPKL